MRGLKIRTDYAFAKVLKVIDADEADGQMEEALLDALALGQTDYHAGRHDTPPLFRDEPELVRAWSWGRDTAADGE